MKLYEEPNEENKKVLFSIDENNEGYKNVVQSYFSRKISNLKNELISENDEDILDLENDNQITNYIDSAGDENYNNIRDLYRALEQYKIKSFIDEKVQITSEEEYEELKNNYTNINSELEENLENFSNNIYEYINSCEQIRRDGDYDELVEHLYDEEYDD